VKYFCWVKELYRFSKESQEQKQEELRPFAFGCDKVSFILSHQSPESLCDLLLQRISGWLAFVDHYSFPNFFKESLNQEW